MKGIDILDAPNKTIGQRSIWTLATD